MKRIITALIMTLLVISFPIISWAFPDPDFEAVTGGISGDDTKGFIGDLTQWSRIAGSTNEKEAAQFIQNTLSGFGYVTDIQKFPILYYEEISWDLKIVNPSGSDELNPNIMTYSPGGNVTAELVYANLGYPEDFANIDATGKIALIKRGELYFREKVANAAEAGAVGAIIFNNTPDNFFGTLVSPAEIPAVSISQQEGEYLLALLDNDLVTVNLNVDAIMVERESQNVVATKPAARDAGTGHTIIIGGHYDNVSAGKGANDNASGTAVMMEVAKALQNYDLNADVKFLAFGAEEIGLCGSEFYVANMSKDEIMKTRAMINLDMVGVGDKLTAGDIRKNDGWLVKFIERYGDAFGQEVYSFEAEENSDHTYFEEQGVPVCFMTWEEDPYYHTAEDSLDKINSMDLEVAGKISAAVIYDLAKTIPPRSDDADKVKINKNKVNFKGKFRDKL